MAEDITHRFLRTDFYRFDHMTRKPCLLSCAIFAFSIFTSVLWAQSEPSPSLPALPPLPGETALNPSTQPATPSLSPVTPGSPVAPAVSTTNADVVAKVKGALDTFIADLDSEQRAAVLKAQSMPPFPMEQLLGRGVGEVIESGESLYWYSVEYMASGEVKFGEVTIDVTAQTYSGPTFYFDSWAVFGRLLVETGDPTPTVMIIDAVSDSELTTRVVEPSEADVVWTQSTNTRVRPDFPELPIGFKKIQ